MRDQDITFGISKAFYSVNSLLLKGFSVTVESHITYFYHSDAEYRPKCHLVICIANLSVDDKINFKTGLNQGCLLSSFFFTSCIEWIMRETNKRTEISWSMSEMLGDLHNVDFRR